MRQSSEDFEEFPPRKTRKLSEIHQSCNFATVEPTSFEEAAKEVWMNATEEELHMIKKNETWELDDRPTGKKIIGVKWIYKIKLNEEGNMQWYKARLVAKGFAQKPCIDFFETFSPVAQME